MKELIFATHNANKVKEIQGLIRSKYKVLSLDDIGYRKEIPEYHLTIEGNALGKAKHIYNVNGVSCFADDTGLEVEMLNGQPGVFSARFAELTGEVKPGENISEANIRKLLRIMNDLKNRRARFKTIIALILDGKQYIFEGIVDGQVLTVKRGNSGFGYDPIFLPSGFDQTFAEMSLKMKNSISHRAKAVCKLIEFLGKQ